jgi:hypothetical protein
MRIRHLTLPTRVVGELVHEPFVIVIDRATTRQSESIRANERDMIKNTGATALWVFDDSLGDVELGDYA